MTPTVGFRSQPLDPDRTAGAFVSEVLGDTSITHLIAVVAWARFRGLARIKADIEGFRRRGGHATIVVGIDEGGATRAGLVLASRMFDDAYVFHDPASITFHPKLYLAKGPTSAVLVVGSSNATPGGFYANYEASLEARFELPAEETAPALVDAEAFIDRLVTDGKACSPLTEALVDELVRNPRYRVATHEHRTRPGASPPEAPGAEAEDVDETGSDDGAGADLPIFGPSKHKKPPIPPLSAEDKAELLNIEGSPPPQPPASPAGGTPPPGGVAPAQPTVVEQWSSRPLTEGNAQRPAGHVTGNLRLVQGNRRGEIDQRTWFRQKMFSGVPWAKSVDSRGNSIEVAVVNFDVTLRGVSKGSVPLKVDHAPHRESAQNNHATVVHWGSLMADFRGVDYTGDTVTIERMSDGTFRLEIAP